MYCIGGWSGCCSSASVRFAWVSSSCGRPASHITCWLRSLRTSDLSTSQVCAWRSRESWKWRDAVNVLNFNIFLNLFFLNACTCNCDIYVAGLRKRKNFFSPDDLYVMSHSSKHWINSSNGSSNFLLPIILQYVTSTISNIQHSKNKIHSQ